LRVFISWSGSLSKETAESLRDILPCMLQGVDVFLSQHDIESGSRWALELASALQESSFGIICLTPSNQTSPWLLFEAGALTKHMSGRACGLLLGGLRAADVSGPLAQFQHREFSMAGVLSIINDVNAKSDSPLKDTQVKMVFDKWWPDLESAYDRHLNAAKDVISAPRRMDRDILEEILLRVRQLQQPRSEQHVVTTTEEETSLAVAASPWIRAVIENFGSHLTQTQRSLLFEISAGKRSGDPERVARAISSASGTDLEVLLATGFLTKDAQGEIRILKILAEYFGECAQTAAT
jgi:hypothetical protein